MSSYPGGRGRVELGVTHTFIKERFGARIQPLKVFHKASNPFLDFLLRSAFDVKSA